MDVDHNLDLIDVTQKFIIALDEASLRHPELSTEIAEAIAIEKRNLELFRQRLGL